MKFCICKFLRILSTLEESTEKFNSMADWITLAEINPRDEGELSIHTKPLTVSFADGSFERFLQTLKSLKKKGQRTYDDT